MPEQGTSGEPPERRYDETQMPENPPNAVLRPRARRAAVGTFLGGIILLFLIVGAALLFWKATDRSGGQADEREDPAAVGTMGRPQSTTLPGGFDPGPNHADTKSEMEYRGVDEAPQGPLPALTSEESEKKDK